MKKRSVLKYNGIPVCKADFDTLTELEITKGKIDRRLDLAIKTLADFPADSKDKNVILLQQFIDVTYENSVKGINEKRQAILDKYPVPERVVFKKRIKAFTVCLSVLLIASLILLCADARKKDTPIYLSSKSHKYHTDYYCSSLTGMDKAKGAVTKKMALEEGYSPCANCSK